MNLPDRVRREAIVVNRSPEAVSGWDVRGRLDTIEPALNCVMDWERTTRRRMDLLENTSVKAWDELDERTKAAHGEMLANERHIVDVAQMHHDFVTRGFWGRLIWVLCGR